MPRLHPRTGKLLPEVLSPVGSPDCLPAAVAGGADAVFLGLRHFNARGRAENFRKADLAGHVRYLHDHDVRCYVVMNTLVHDDEFPKALDLAGAACDAGVDAAIIQDLGLWRLLAREMPTLKRHASTQMTIHHPSQVAVLASLGAERVILARELSMAEVGACTREAQRLGIETEHFVHGALCYAFSGQCLMSNFAGCRSANRGTCAQNCRFDYTTGEGAIGTEISMKDLALFAQIPELATAGVASLKIEGRLKGPDYVYTTARIYRAAVDAWAAGKPLDVVWAQDLQRDVFNRANTSAPLDGVYDTRSRLHRYAPEQDLTADAELRSIDRGRGEAILKAPLIRAGQGYAYTVGEFNGGFLVIGADRLERQTDTWRCKIRIPPHGPQIPSGTKLFRNADHVRKQEAAAAMATVPLPTATGDLIDVHLVVTGSGAATGDPHHQGLRHAGEFTSETTGTDLKHRQRLLRTTGHGTRTQLQTTRQSRTADGGLETRGVTGAHALRRHHQRQRAQTERRVIATRISETRHHRREQRRHQRMRSDRHQHQHHQRREPTWRTRAWQTTDHSCGIESGGKPLRTRSGEFTRHEFQGQGGRQVALVITTRLLREPRRVRLSGCPTMRDRGQDQQHHRGSRQPQRQRGNTQGFRQRHHRIQHQRHESAERHHAGESREGASNAPAPDGGTCGRDELLSGSRHVRSLRDGGGAATIQRPKGRRTAATTRAR